MKSSKILADYSTEDLERELTSRKQIKRPKPLSHGTHEKADSFCMIRDYCETFLKEAEKDRRFEKDTEHYLYEYVLEIIYGKDIWHWHSEIES